ncbi:MAG TPA: PrsW family glutamic-type intramembrane protease [Bacteroidota bacterium]|nr:PrsW family glutamic-type intramembrane protease [Bacteroidota bacterium]
MIGPSVVDIGVSLLPVFIFLTVLIFLDSFKLVKLSSIILAILVGCIVVGIALFVNTWLLNLLPIDDKIFRRYGAPIVEEVLKASYIIYLMKNKKIGFMVDGAIYGFAIGTGFGCIENIYYLQSLPHSTLLLWIIRGFGTAIMHGGATAIFGIIAKNYSERKSSESIHFFLPGLLIAIFIHSIYNHVLLPPHITTVLLLIILPTLMMVVFNQSEKATRQWLGVGFDTDAELLEMINTGKISETKVGNYLQSLMGRFPGEVVADMFCFLRIHLELSVRAKGILLMRETGFTVAPDPEVKEKFMELKYLEKSIGITGRRAILPFIHTTSRDLWQLHMLGKN